MNETDKAVIIGGVALGATALGLYLLSEYGGGGGGGTPQNVKLIVNVAATDATEVSYALGSEVMPYLLAGDTISISHDPSNAVTPAALTTINSVADQFSKAGPAGLLVAALSGYTAPMAALAKGCTKPISMLAATLEPDGATPNIGPTMADAEGYFETTAKTSHAGGFLAVGYPSSSYLPSGSQAAQNWDYGKLASLVDYMWVEMQGFAYNGGKGGTTAFSTALDQLIAQMKAANQSLDKLAIQIILGTGSSLGVNPTQAEACIAIAAAAGIPTIMLWSGSGSTGMLGTVIQSLRSGPTPPPPPPPPPPSGGPSKVMVVMLENNNWSDVTGGKAPYVLSLARQYGSCSNYLATNQANGQSLPNYMMLTAGQNCGITADETPQGNQVSERSIFDNVTAKGLKWVAYAEGYPGSASKVYLGAPVGLYAGKHVPSLFYKSLTAAAPYQTLPFPVPTSGFVDYTFVSPNLDDDGHNTSITVADTWLSKWLPPILASTDFTSGELAIFIVTDNGVPPSAPTICVVCWAGMKSPVSITSAVNHYSTLGTIEQILGLPYLTANDTGAAKLSQFFP